MTILVSEMKVSIALNSDFLKSYFSQSLQKIIY